MPARMIFNFPPGYVESVGWATICWAHLETSLDILLGIGAQSRQPRANASASLVEKVDRLRALAGDHRLKQRWRDDLNLIANNLVQFEVDVHNTIYGTLYSRGVDSISLSMRELYEKTSAAPIVSRMTKAKIDELILEMTVLTRMAIVLAGEMCETFDNGSERMSQL